MFFVHYTVHNITQSGYTACAKVCLPKLKLKASHVWIGVCLSGTLRRFTKTIGLAHYQFKAKTPKNDLLLMNVFFG